MATPEDRKREMEAHYNALARRIAFDYGEEPPKVFVLSRQAIHKTMGRDTPGFCDVDGTICLAPDAGDIVFFHEMSHFLHPHVSGEQFHDMEGFDLEQKYLRKLHIKPRPGATFRRPKQSVLVHRHVRRRR